MATAAMPANAMQNSKSSSLKRCVAVDVVDVENAERLVLAADERDADRRANLLHEDRLAAEARVLAGVVGENRDLVLERRAGDRLRHRARACRRRVCRAQIFGTSSPCSSSEKNGDAIDLENLVRVARRSCRAANRCRRALPSPLETSSSVASFCRLLSDGPAGASCALGATVRVDAEDASAAFGSRTGSWRTIVAPGDGVGRRRGVGGGGGGANCCSRNATLPNVTMSPDVDRSRCRSARR